jgi:hypothetical protein
MVSRWKANEIIDLKQDCEKTFNDSGVIGRSLLHPVDQSLLLKETRKFGTKTLL